jgi:hypothetical protein
MATKKTETLKPMAVKKMPVNKPAMPGPTSANAMGKSGTFLENVNVRPTRLQTAKHDAKFWTNFFIKDIKSDFKSKKIGDKARGVLGAVATIATAPPSLGYSLFNVASGQARYNKNKRAGMERPEYVGSREQKLTNMNKKSISKSDSLSASRDYPLSESPNPEFNNQK